MPLFSGVLIGQAGAQASKLGRMKQLARDRRLVSWLGSGKLWLVGGRRQVGVPGL